MKKLVVLAVLVIAGVVVFDYATGNLGLVPSGDESPEVQDVRALEGRFNAAKRQINQATRTAGLSGVDTTGDLESARKELFDLHSEVTRMIERLTDEAARKDATELERAIKQLRSELNW